jgi:hypothetical protein
LFHKTTLLYEKVFAVAAVLTTLSIFAVVGAIPIESDCAFVGKELGFDEGQVNSGPGIVRLSINSDETEYQNHVPADLPLDLRTLPELYAL